VPRPASGADEVPGDERLAVAGRQRVCRSPEGRDEKRDEDDAGREVAVLDQCLEPAAGMGRRRDAAERRRCPWSVAGHEAGCRGTDVERRAEQLARIGAELVGAAHGGHGGVGDAGAVPRDERDLPPADPARIAPVGELEPRAGERCRVHGLEAQRRQAARALPRADPVRDGAQDDPGAVESQLELALRTRRRSRARARGRPSGRSGSRRGRARDGHRPGSPPARCPRSGSR
jgi:hypothetical protein